jgi:hypothetical protein
MIIARRFRGPPESGNGGYFCGVAAALLEGGDVEVTLRSPAPLDVELVGERNAAGATLRAGERVLAEAAPTALAIDVPPPVGFEEARVASERGFPWKTSHPYPSCFVCGPERAAGDGLCIYPGAVAGRAVAAAPWVPDASVSDGDGRVHSETVWAALDCPSWFGFLCFHEWSGGLILLGRMAAHIEERPRAGDRCVAMGWFSAREGRKIHCGSALQGADGRLYAAARATWIVLK